MISKQTTTRIVKHIKDWMEENQLTEKQVSDLLRRLGKVGGNQSFKSSIWIIYCNLKNLSDEETELIMRTRAGIQLPVKRETQ
jgi:hypothetical protein